jgi:hypothetical protein
MGQTGCPETSVPNYRPTLRSIPEQQGLGYRAAIACNVARFVSGTRYPEMLQREGEVV